jgi:membrane protease YdiL (CAAX protease family)
LAPPAGGHTTAAAVTAYHLGFALRDVAFAALILYLIWRSAGSLEPAGILRLHWWKELLTAGAILLASAIAALMAGLLAHAAHLPIWASDSMGETRGHLVSIYVFMSALAEELIFRAYLITRLEQLLGRTGWAVLVSATLFAASHVSSPARSLMLLFMGFLWGGVFATWRRLPRLVLAHWAWNLLLLYSRPV